ncbi:MAG: hypothetical protein ABIQ95_11080, partial [Bdellovibrionia bacterium]
DSEVLAYFNNIFVSPERANNSFFGAIDDNLTHLIPIFIEKIPMILLKKSFEGYLPLEYAIRKDRFEVVKILQNAGAVSDNIEIVKFIDAISDGN